MVLLALTGQLASPDQDVWLHQEGYKAEASAKASRFSTVLPYRVFSDEDEQQSLAALGLTPTASLVLKVWNGPELRERFYDANKASDGMCVVTR